MKIITRLGIASFAFAFLLVPTAYAGPEQGWGYQNPPSGVPVDIETTILNITNYVLGIISLIAVLIIIYGGILYLTSMGNADQIAKAKSTIVYGIVGLVIVGLAYAIAALVPALIGGGTT